MTKKSKKKWNVEICLLHGRDLHDHFNIDVQDLIELYDVLTEAVINEEDYENYDGAIDDFHEAIYNMIQVWRAKEGAEQ